MFAPWYYRLANITRSRRWYKNYVGRKVNNAQGLICAKILHFHILPASPPE